MAIQKKCTPVKHFFEYFNERIPQNWNEPAITDFDGDKNYTYGEMATKVAQLQVLLQNAGLERGDKVVICSKNCSNWAISFLSIAANRGVIVSIMDAFMGNDIEKLINHSDAKAVFVGDSVWQKIHIENLPNIKLVLSTTNFELLYARTEEQEKAYAQKEQLFSEKYPNGFGKADIALPTDNMDDLMIINYTSGTTSDPKGVMLSYRAISANVHYSQETIPNHAGWAEVCMLPLAHMFGMTIEFLYQVAGGCHVYFLSKTPSPSVLMRAFAETKPYMILTVPLVLEKIFKAKIFPALETDGETAVAHTFAVQDCGETDLQATDASLWRKPDLAHHRWCSHQCRGGESVPSNQVPVCGGIWYDRSRTTDLLRPLVQRGARLLRKSGGPLRTAY